MAAHYEYSTSNTNQLLRCHRNSISSHITCRMYREGNLNNGMRIKQMLGNIIFIISCGTTQPITERNAYNLSCMQLSVIITSHLGDNSRRISVVCTSSSFRGIYMFAQQSSNTTSQQKLSCFTRANSISNLSFHNK